MSLLAGHPSAQLEGVEESSTHVEAEDTDVELRYCRLLAEHALISNFIDAFSDWLWVSFNAVWLPFLASFPPGLMVPTPMSPSMQPLDMSPASPHISHIHTVQR